MTNEQLEKFKLWASMIRSDQMESHEVVSFLKNNPEFALWYLKDIGDAVEA